MYTEWMHSQTLEQHYIQGMFQGICGVYRQNGCMHAETLEQQYMQGMFQVEHKTPSYLGSLLSNAVCKSA